MSFIDNIRQELKSDYIIGAYHRDGAGGYFDDLRGAAGERIENFDGNAISQRVYVNQVELTEDEFYEFDWSIEGNSETDYKYTCKGNIRPVDKARMLQVRLSEKMDQRGTVRKDANQNQEMINREVTGAPHTYIYELLQNSNDYPLKDSNNKKIPVEVKFILTEHYLFFIHTGAPFNLRNIAAICTVNEGEKRDNIETIGYKGMGFKSVFVNNDYVFLSSGDWNLRFDEKHINKPGGYKRNWQYMPIPTNLTELDDEVKNVLSSLPQEYNVFFALRHKTNARENEPNLRKVFGDDQILVFIPNVDHVEVSIDDEIIYDVFKDRNKWIIKDDLTITVDDQYKRILERSIKSGNKIPEKFQKIKDISISFAVKRDGNMVVPVDNANIYNYLPTEQQLHVPFLINADFVPDASRKAIPDLEWNLKLLEDAGHQFAQWWTSLLDEGLDLSSLFDILPDFRQTDKYRASFMKGFEDEMGRIACIPIEIDSDIKLVPFNQVINDSIKFISSNEPVMTDDDFYALTGFANKHEYLPHPEIRLHPRLIEYLQHYSAKKNVGRNLTKDDLISITYSAGFKDWMKAGNHAHDFYKYLFVSGHMNAILSRNNAIFLTEDNQIVPPNGIYFNIDEALTEIYMFEDLIPRLNKAVRDSLYTSFNGISGIFKRFSAPTQALELASNFDRNGYSSRIKTFEDSRKFLNFLASAKDGTYRYNGYIPQTMPLYLKDCTSQQGVFNLYIESELGNSLREQPWVKNDWVRFINDGYIGWTDDLTNFLKRNGIDEIKPSTIWNDFVTDDERSAHIISSIENKEENIDFYHFLTQIEEVVKFSDQAKQLKTKYHIWANDGENDKLVPLSTVLFFGNSSERDKLLEETWLPAESCWAIDEDYLNNYLGDDRENMQRLLKNNGIAENFSVNSWFKRCLVKEHVWPEVIKKVTTLEDSLTLLDFMFRNQEQAKDFGLKKLRDIPLGLYDEKDMLSLNEVDSKEVVYQLSSDVLRLFDEGWFPSYEITATAKEYESLFDGKDRREFFDSVGIRSFDLDEYIEDTILENLDDFTNFEELENPLQASIDFHRFFANPSLRLSEDNWDALKNSPVYTLTPSPEDGEEGRELQETSTGHFLPSEKIGKLVELDIIPSTTLKSILPEYFESDKDRMETYFRDKLGNRKLEDNEIVKHLVEHKDEISSYLHDYDRNLRFWRWAAQTSTNHEQRKAFRDFPMMDSDFNLLLPPDLFASAVYSKDKEAEDVIRRFIPDAHFVYDGYVEENDNLNWQKLFESLSIGITAKYVILRDVVPKLSEYKTAQDDVVIALAGVTDSIVKEYELFPDKTERDLKQLYVKCNGGYKRITDAIISGEYTGVESGKYVSVILPAQVSGDYLADTEDNPTLRSKIIKLFQFIGKFDGVEAIWKAQELSAKKVSYFLDNQASYLQTSHYQIIGELAEDYNSKVEWVQNVLKGKDLLLKTSTGQTFHTDKARVYLGSVYLPPCDYQAHGVTEIAYVSDEYRRHSNLQVIKTFLINRGVRWGFHGESELKLLQNSEFAIYFWSEFLPSQLKNTDIHTLDHFNRVLSKENLEKYACIPTKEGMKRPSSVYDPSDSTLVRILKALGKENDTLPAVAIPLQYSYGFASQLTPFDCLEYLLLNEKTKIELRLKVYDWLAEYGKDSKLMFGNFKNYLARFKQEVKWRNGKKQWVPLSDLYVLDKSADSKLIMDHFAGSEYVCSWMPESNIIQNELCAMLGIKPLTKDVFDYKPIGDTREDADEEREIKKRLLYLSYAENPNGNWEEKYLERTEKLEKARIECCDDIRYFYENDERLSVRLYFLDNKEEGFSYKKGYKERKSDSIIEWVCKNFSITSFEISFLESLFFEPFAQFVNDHNGGELPKDVLKYLSDSDRDEITEETTEEAPEEISEPYVSTAQVPETHVPVSDDESEDEEIEDEDNDEEEEDDEPINVPGSKKPSETPSSDHQRDNTPKPRVDHKSIPVRSSEKSDEDEKHPKPKESFEERSQKRWDERRDAKVTPPTSAQSTHKEDEEILDIEDKVDTKPSYGEVFNPSAKPRIKRHSDNEPAPIKEKKRGYEKQVEDARKKAEEEEEKRDRRSKMHDLEPYTLCWFNYLIDMQLEVVKEYKSSQRVIDFYDWALMDKDKNIYRLVAPSSSIPSNLAEASNARIKLVSNGKTTSLPAEIVESDETGIDLKCNAFFGSASPTKWIRIEYENVGGFSQALANRFSRLAYTYSLTTNLKDKLPKDISFIYGPPGTGKTTELVKRISEAIRTNAKINILVVTPTNRAADEIAERLAIDTFSSDFLSRYGVTESRDLIANHPEVLKNRQNMSLKSSHKNVMVTTIARYPYDSVEGEAIFDINWDLIIVDEASMIDLVPITLLLINNKAPKFLIAGDPKQIRPVKPSFDFPDEFVFNIYDMVKMNSFKDAKEGKCSYSVDVLDVQHRSVAEIGNLVSGFAYENVLKNDPSKAKAKVLNIPEIKVNPINVVGYEVIPMSHLYDFNTVDKSHVHVYSAIFAYEFAAYIANLVKDIHSEEPYSIGIVSPYKKQADAIQEMLTNRFIGNSNCSIKCGTVHKFQGSQCDIMIVVMNYPDTFSGEKANINNQNIMNVAMSRAKDYVFFLSPEKKVGEKANYPMNDEIFQLLSKLQGDLKLIHAHELEKIIFGDEVYIAKNSSLRSHLPVNVSTPTGKRYEVRISDTALDIQIND